jgi:acetolactate synthase-1/2/3 large subunit
VVHPERTVVCVSGDGDFLMSGHELAAAVQEDLPIVVLVVNNNMYGTIRMHQERLFPRRVFATDLVNPDFAAWAHAFGASGEVVLRSEDFPDTFERARSRSAGRLFSSCGSVPRPRVACDPRGCCGNWRSVVTSFA